MHLGYFTERPYRYFPDEQIISRGFFGTSNTYFDSGQGPRAL